MRLRRLTRICCSSSLCLRGIHSGFNDDFQPHPTRRAMQRLLERFWSPFCVSQTGPDLKKYRFQETMSEICTNDECFTCQVNGIVGDVKLLENFFIVLLSGFDIENALVEHATGRDAVSELCEFKGNYRLRHTRPFLGWSPSVPIQTLPSQCAHESVHGGQTIRDTGDSCVAKAETVLLHVPFTARLEGVNNQISHMVLRSPALDTIMNCPGCPAGVQECLQSGEALRALVSLRRANVCPTLISDKTISGITRKKDLWASALGIL